MTRVFTLHNSQFCDDVPTQVQALSSSIKEHYYVANGGHMNSIGTVCGWYDWYDRFPGAGSTDASKVLDAEGVSGFVPTGERERAKKIHQHFLEHLGGPAGI